MAARKSSRATAAVQQLEGVVTYACASPRLPALIVILWPWCVDGGPVRSDKMSLQLPMKDQRAVTRQLGKWENLNVVVSARRVVGPNESGAFYRATGPLSRAPLESKASARRQQQAKPRVEESTVLGRMLLDRASGSFKGKRGRGTARYGVSVDVSHPDDDKAVARAMVRSERIVQELEQELPRIREAIALWLLGVYNDEWRTSKGELSAAAFQRAQRLGSVSVGVDTVVAYFTCGKLFAGHFVEVRMTPRLRIDEVCLSG